MPDEFDHGHVSVSLPERAIAYLEELGRNILVTGSWRELWQHAHARAFTVAHGMQQDIVADIYRCLHKALASNFTERQFIEHLKPILIAKDWWGHQEIIDQDTGEYKVVQLGSPSRLGTIFRTNANVACMVAGHEVLAGNIDKFPYWQYKAIIDAHTRPSHAALDSLIFKWDDPFWDTHYPPNGCNCRCRVVALSQQEVEDRGLQVVDGSKHLEEKGLRDGRIARTGKLVKEKPIEFRMGDKVMTPDPGWNYNPAWVGLGTLQRADIRKLEEGIVKAEQAGHAAQAIDDARQSIREGLRSEQWRHFVETTKPQDGNVWPVATITPNRLKQMGLPDDARVVQIRSKNIVKKSHRNRYRTWGENDWSLVQSMIDEGTAIPNSKYKGNVKFRDEQDGQSWILVLGYEEGSNDILLRTAH